MKKTIYSRQLFPQLRRTAKLTLEMLSASWRQGFSTVSCLVLWLGMALAGMGLLWQYQHQPGELQATPDRWPANSQLTRAIDQPTLLFFAHPKCPCTRASIDELARIMTHCQGQVQTYAIFVKPTDAAADDQWDHGDLWISAEQIPGVITVCDVDGKEAQRFQAATSGLAILYDQAGQILFRGGITASRGHSGDNLGSAAIIDLLTQGSALVDHTEVYGCELGTTNTDQGSSCCRQ
jgi:hypothetical protein